MMLGTINVVLVTEDTDAHAGAWDIWQSDGARETLITLRIVVLEADLQLDGLEEVALLGVLGVVEQLLDVLSDAGDRDLRHVDGLPEDELSVSLGEASSTDGVVIAVVVVRFCANFGLAGIF